MPTPIPGKPTTRRKRRPEAPRPAATSDTRARILEVAKSRFAIKGFAGVSMREIATACQLTLPTLYHYFGHKRGLFLACRAAVLDDAAAQVRAALAGNDAHDRVMSATVVLCSLLFGDARLLAFMQFEFHDRAHSSRSGPRRWDLLPELTAAIEAVHPGVRRMAGLSAAESMVGVVVGHALVHRARWPHGPAVDAGQFARDALALLTAA